MNYGQSEMDEKKDDTTMGHVEYAANKEAVPDSLLKSIEDTKTGYYTWLVSTTLLSVDFCLVSDDLGHALDSSKKELITSITSGGAFGLDNMSITGGSLVACSV
ncbi:hypothetical protein MW887_004437 [Aspergillus wentii]|nr:hypothetical protein MW887_004437 [Aspergillus wentii]